MKRLTPYLSARRKALVPLVAGVIVIALDEFAGVKVPGSTVEQAVAAAITAVGVERVPNK
jgi:hypothetical protein